MKIAVSLHLLSPKSLKLDLSEQGWTAVIESVLPMYMQPHKRGLHGTTQAVGPGLELRLYIA